MKSMRRREAAFYQAVAHCLDYPDSEFYRQLPLLSACAGQLRPFIDYAQSVAPGELARNYVQTFDFQNRHCLHLTWWLDGDTRRRGESLVRIKQLYRSHGMDFTDADLPDYLPVVLEFTAATGVRDLLLDHRAGLELLRLALAEVDTPYTHVLNALCAALPGPSPRDRAAARALARQGPRGETVGIDTAPYGHLDLLPVISGGDR